MNTMLPAAPKTLGRLSEVFKSASLAVQNKPNPFGFKQASHVVVILVDGLGAENLRNRSGHAPFLNRRLGETKSIDCSFPSTTASSVTSFLTGLPVGQHGVIGYSVFDRDLNRGMNLLTGWGDGQLVRDFAQHSSIAQWSQSSGVQAFTIGPPEYSDSGFTELNNAGSIYIPAKTLSERFQAARKSLKGSGKSITYLYVPELDKAAHATGCESTAWLYLLEELDQEVEQLVSGLDNSAAVVLTADHGVVDVESSAHIYLDEITSVAMRHASGDPRATFIYLEEYQDVQLAIQTFSEHLGANAYVASAAEVVDKGWFGPDVSERSLALMPDIFLLAKTKCAFYHRDYCKPQALRMIGQHGSISSTELKVPLLTWGSIC